jgi:hypothetical protein
MINIIFIFIFMIIPVIGLAHTGELDNYGCHYNSQIKKRECHQDLLQGQVFATVNAEYIAYITAQKKVILDLQVKMGEPRVQPLNVPMGTAIKVTINNSPGSPRDWVGVFDCASGDVGEIDWMYLNGEQVPPATGVTSVLIVIPLPDYVGCFEFRLYSNDGYTRLATSVPIFTS